MKKCMLAFLLAILLSGNVLVSTAYAVQEAEVIEQTGDLSVVPNSWIPPKIRGKS